MTIRVTIGELTDEERKSRVSRVTISAPNPWESPEQAAAWLEGEMQKELSKLIGREAGPIYYTPKWRGRIIQRANAWLRKYPPRRPGAAK